MAVIMNNGPALMVRAVLNRNKFVMEGYTAEMDQMNGSNPVNRNNVLTICGNARPVNA